MYVRGESSPRFLQVSRMSEVERKGEERNEKKRGKKIRKDFSARERV